MNDNAENHDGNELAALENDLSRIVEINNGGIRKENGSRCCDSNGTVEPRRKATSNGGENKTPLLGVVDDASYSTLNK